MVIEDAFLVVERDQYISISDCTDRVSTVGRLDNEIVVALKLPSCDDQSEVIWSAD
jgi:hypothetical protein